jgi:aspartate-semialdehyde dehydrogenase
VFSSAGGTVSKAHAWRWAEHGAVVIDNTSAHRLDPRVPLVVPGGERRGGAASTAA